MSSPWSSVRDVSPEASRLLVERAHEELLAGNIQDRRLQNVRRVVRESWERSWRHRVGAESRPSIVLEGAALDAHRRDHPLSVAMSAIRALLLPGDSARAGVILAVGDESGRLLWVEGDAPKRALAGNMGFIAGADWSERTIGTTAPGTALLLKRPVQIHDAEHYNRLVQPWSCTAAPVFDPETKDVLGVIDVTGGPEAATPQAALLLDATVRAVESEILIRRLRTRAEAPGIVRRPRPRPTTRAMLHVLGRDRALLEINGSDGETIAPLSARHAEILLMLAVHRQGLSAERLAELVYGPGASPDTLRPEVVRLRRVLAGVSQELTLESRPYRLGIPLQTDAQNVLALLDRGSHRVALSAYRGPVLPESSSPGAEEYRDTVRGTLREALTTEAGVEVLLAYADIPDGAEDLEVLRLCLEMLPARSPRRAALVTRIERIEQEGA